MTDEDKETVYDNEIAPLLLRAGQLATEAGIPLLCAAEWNSGHIGTTQSNFELSSISPNFFFLLQAMQSGNNLDGLVLGIIRYCRENGINTDSSFVAHKMGTVQR